MHKHVGLAILLLASLLSACISGVETAVSDDVVVVLPVLDGERYQMVNWPRLIM